MTNSVLLNFLMMYDVGEKAKLNLISIPIFYRSTQMVPRNFITFIPCKDIVSVITHRVFIYLSNKFVY